MPFKRYDPKAKAAIVAAAEKARRDGETWREAFEAAKRAGYKGRVRGLVEVTRLGARKVTKRVAALNYDRPADAARSERKITLASLAKSAFESEVQSRGERYYYEQTVSIEHTCSTAVVAQVKGGRSYTVTLDLLDDELLVDCDCPYFSAAGLCKHIWATILASDANNFIMPPTDCLDLLVTPADKIDDAPEDDEGEPWRKANIVRLADHRQVPPPPAPWKTNLVELWRAEQAVRLENSEQSPADQECQRCSDTGINPTV